MSSHPNNSANIPQSSLSLAEQLKECQAAGVLKDKKILMLAERISQLGAEVEKLREEAATKDRLIQNYHANLYAKNVQLSELETRIQAQVAQRLQAQESEAQVLRQIIRDQEEELTLFLNDSAGMASTASQLFNRYGCQNEEKNLMQAYIGELESQIEELEQQNERCIAQIEGLRAELGQQNQQGEDLICQVGAMLTHIQSAA